MITIRKLISAWTLALVGSLLFPLVSVAAVWGTTYDTPSTTTMAPTTIAEHTASVETGSSGEISMPGMASGPARSLLALSGSLVAPKNVSSRILGTSQKQLQKKFKHASDFGVGGNFNKANAAKFNSAINQHINSPGVKAIQGTYRGNPVTHYVNPETGLNAIADQSGNFVSGWKLGAEQLQNVLTRGSL